MTKNQDIGLMGFKVHPINCEQLTKERAAGVIDMETEDTNTAPSKVEYGQFGDRFQRSDHYATFSHSGKQADERKSQRKSMGFRGRNKDISSGKPITAAESDHGTKGKGGWLQKALKKVFGKTSESNNDNFNASQEAEGFARRPAQPSGRVDDKKSSKSGVLQRSDFDDPNFQGKLLQTPKTERIQEKRNANDHPDLHKEGRQEMLMKLLTGMDAMPFHWKAEDDEENTSLSEVRKKND